jgi:hypothetical protein
VKAGAQGWDEGAVLLCSEQDKAKEVPESGCWAGSDIKLPNP